MKFFPSEKTPVYLILGIIFLAMAIFNFIDSKVDESRQIVFNTIYVLAGILLIIGSRMIVFKNKKR